MWEMKIILNRGIFNKVRRDYLSYKSIQSVHGKAFNIRNHILKPLNAKFLDFGCGTGWATALAHNDGFDAYCFDVSTERRINKETILARNPKNFLLADGQKLPFKDEAFDIIYCCHVIEHIPDDRKALAEIQRTLADDGILFLSVPNKYNLSSKFKTILRLKTHFIEPSHIREYDQDELLSLLETYGFKILAIKNSGFLLPFGSILLNFLVIQFNLRCLKRILCRLFPGSSESIDVMACKNTLNGEIIDSIGKVVPSPWWV
jgi:ubiquinone/menaquinone biosynthesis C-methylase UbiE